MLKYDLLNRYSLRIVVFLLIIIGTFPLRYSDIVSGLDPSWKLALNIIRNNDFLFGKDYFFTYGPLGWLLYPLNVSDNIFFSACFWIVLHSCFACVLLYMLFSNEMEKYWKRSINVLFMMIFILFAVCFQASWQEYYFIYLLLFLLMLGIESKYSHIWIVLACLLVVFSFFIKFTIAILSYGCLILFAMWIAYQTKRIGKEFCVTIIGVPIGFCLAFIIYNPDFSAIVNYVCVAKEISSGYIYAMSAPIPHGYTLFVIIFIVLSVLVGYYAILARDFFRYILFSVVIFVAFKHGVVRGDHINIFISVFLMCCSVEVFFFRKELFIKNKNVLFITLFLFTMWGYTGIYPVGVLKSSINNCVLAVNFMLGEDANQSIRDERNAFISERFWRTIDNSSFTIYPWEISYGFEKNNLKIMPILQQYSAYTPKLDEINAEFIRKDVEFIIFNLDAIDGRYPLLETPVSWREILNTYSVVDYDGRNFLLRKKDKVDSYEYTVFSRKRVNISDNISIPQSHERMFVSFENNLNILGNLVKILWKIPEINMVVELENGNTISRRILLENLKNPVLIDAIPYDDVQFLEIMRGDKSESSVKSIRLEGDGLKYYEDMLKVSFFTSHVDQNDTFSFENVCHDIQFEIDNKNEIESSLDSINGEAFHDNIRISGSYLIINGWAFNKLHKNLFDEVYIAIDDDIYYSYTTVRPDVSMYFQNKELENSGFKILLSTQHIATGKHNVDIIGKSNGVYIKKRLGAFYFDKSLERY